jgi:hypothetical protein
VYVWAAQRRPPPPATSSSTSARARKSSSHGGRRARAPAPPRARCAAAAMCGSLPLLLRRRSPLQWPSPARRPLKTNEERAETVRGQRKRRPMLARIRRTKRSNIAAAWRGDPRAGVPCCGSRRRALFVVVTYRRRFAVKCGHHAKACCSHGAWHAALQKRLGWGAARVAVRRAERGAHSCQLRGRATDERSQKRWNPPARAAGADDAPT